MAQWDIQDRIAGTTTATTPAAATAAVVVAAKIATAAAVVKSYSSKTLAAVQVGVILDVTWALEMIIRVVE